MTSRRLIPCAVLLIVGFVLFPSTVHDDAHITYWAAHALAEKGQLVNHNGQAVEQSSSLAFVLIIAFLRKILPLSISTIAPIVSILAGVGTVVLVQRLAGAAKPGLEFPAGLLAASSSILIYWSFSGMETSLAAFLGVGLMLTYVGVLREDVNQSRYVWAFGATLLYLLVRPEAVFVVAALMVSIAGLVWMRLALGRQDLPDAPARLRGVAALGVIAFVAFAAIVAFRVLYFGDVVPEPVRAKAGGLSVAVLKDGIHYLFAHAWKRVDSLIWILAIPASAYALRCAYRDDRFNLPETMAALFLAAQLGFVVTSGGDWMENGRFLVQALPAASVVVLGVLSTTASVAVLRSAVALLVSLNLLGVLATARYESTGSPIWAVNHLSGMPLHDFPWFDKMNRNLYAEQQMALRVDEIVQRLQQQQHHTISIMSGQMGIVPYRISSRHDGVVRFIDTCALATKDFLQCPVSAGLQRTRYGLGMTYRFFFEHRREFAQTCGLGDPDIIIRVDAAHRLDATVIGENGYTIAYVQEMDVTSGSRLFPGASVRARELIAVRDDLMNPSLQLGEYHFSR